MVDPEEFSNPPTPGEDVQPPYHSPSPMSPTAGSPFRPAPLTGLAEAMSRTNNSGSPGSPGGAPSSPVSPGGFRRGHSRQASLGTTMTSPSTRRRSVESTISLIREAVDGRGEDDQELEAMADRVSSPNNKPPGAIGAATAGATPGADGQRFVGGFMPGHMPSKSQ